MEVYTTTSLAKNIFDSSETTKGFMGISIRNRFFTKEVLEEYLAWGSEIFSEFAILLVDDPDMYNLELFKGLPSSRALQKARDISENTGHSVQSIINRRGYTNITIVKYQDFEQEPGYQEILNAVDQYVDESEIFKDLLIETIYANIGKRLNEHFQVRDYSEVDKGRAILKLMNYLIGEVAGILYMHRCGYSIEVDPTPEMRIITEIYYGELRQLATKLKLPDRGHIFAKPEDTETMHYSPALNTDSIVFPT